MKKLHSIMMLFAIMVTALGFTACSDDDDDNKGGVEASIVGKWEHISTDVDPIEALEQGFEEKDISVIEYTSKGKYFGYSENGDKVESGSWTLDGNLLYATDDTLPIPFTFTILQLTETTLKFETKVTTLLYNEQTEELEETEVTIQSTYTRIS